MTSSNISRRGLLAGAATVAATPATARTISGDVPWTAGAADAPDIVSPGPYRFFTPDEVAFITAAVARLIPEDEVGPGAVDAGVPNFIDLQLAGDYGSAAGWYMLGPWRHGAATQGYQTRLTPAQLYRYAMETLDAHLAQSGPKKKFAALTAEQQDEVLTHLEKGDIELAQVDGRAFFDLLLQNTIEGYFCDPIHGGNRDMAAWKMIGFPGARYDWRDHIAHGGKRIDVAPVSIAGRPGWNSKS